MKHQAFKHAPHKVQLKIYSSVKAYTCVIYKHFFLVIYLQAKRLFLFTKVDILFQKKDCVVHNNKAICSWKLVVTVNRETV